MWTAQRPITSLLTNPLPSRKKTRPEYQTQLERERMKLERVKAAYADGIDMLEEYKHNKSEVLASIAELESKLRQHSRQSHSTQPTPA